MDGRRDIGRTLGLEPMRMLLLTVASAGVLAALAIIVALFSSA